MLNLPLYTTTKRRNEMALHETKLTITVYLDTDENDNPDDQINELLNRLGEVDTESFGVHWDEAQWNGDWN